MAYGTIKVDTVTFTSEGIDTSVSISGLVRNPTFSGNITSTSTISGVTIQGGTLVSGATVTGSAGQFTTITGGTVNFTTITGTTAVITSGVFASGTAAAPSVSVGTTTNGIYSPGANQVAISTGGTGRLFVDASGNVGVGTSPSTLLHIAQSGSVYFRVQQTTSGSEGTLYLGCTSSANQIISAGASDSTAKALRFDVGTTEAMRLDSSGRLGLGTSIPSIYGAQLAVIGGSVHADRNIGGAVAQVQFSMGASSGANFGQIGNTGTRWSLGYGTTANTIGTEVLVWNSSGNVGIGTTSPSRPLHVSSSGSEQVILSSTSGSLAGIFFEPNGTTYTPFFGATGNSLVSYTQGLERARIDGSGNLGLGTSSPLTNGYPALTVSSNTQANLYFEDTGYESTGNGVGWFSWDNGALAFSAGSRSGTDTTGSSEYLRIDSSGRLLVGTSSQSGGSLLQINDNRIRIATAKTPASATDTGVAGEICWDANYVYVCTATNTWKRSAISTW
jgi:hypothetical protein